MKWLKEFINKNKKLTIALGAALLVSVGVPVYIATPLSNQAVDQLSEHLNKDDREDDKKEVHEHSESEQPEGE